MSEAIIVTSFEQALGLISAKETVDWNNVTISPALLSCRIKVSGEGYESSFSGRFIKGLAVLQDALYRTYAISKSGHDSLKYLNQDEREALTLLFTVNSGCTDIEAACKEGLGFFERILKDMPPMLRAIVLIAIAGIAAGVWVWTTDSNNDKEIRLSEISSDTASNALQTVSKDHQQALNTIVDIVKSNERVLASLHAADKYYSEAKREIVRNAGDVTSISIGNKEYSTEEVRDIQTPGKRLKGRWLPNEEISVQVVALERVPDKGIVIEVKESQTEQVYRMVLTITSASEDPVLSEFAQEEENETLKALVNSFSNQTDLRMQVAKHQIGDFIDRVNFLGLVRE